MITKEKLIRHIKKLPDEISIDELIGKLIFIEKLENRIELSKNVKDGDKNLISDENLKSEVEEWFK